MKNQICLLDTKALLDQEVYRYWYQKMPPGRRAKIDAFRFDKDKRLSLGAGILLQDLLLREGMKQASLTFGPGGKPFLEGQASVHFNLSHSGNLVACAASDRPVGVDIEEVTHLEDDVCRFVFQEQEIEWIRNNEREEDAGFIALWTIKESLVKYWGTGIATEPKTIGIRQDGPIRAFCKDGLCQGIWFTRYEMPGYQMTVCSEYEEFPRKPEWFIPGS